MGFKPVWEPILSLRECQKWIRSINFIQFEPLKTSWGPPKALKLTNAL